MKPFYFVLQNPKLKENQHFVNYAREQLLDKKLTLIFYADQQEAKQSAKPPYILATLVVNESQMGGEEVKTLEKFSTNDIGDFHLLVKNNKLLLANAAMIENDILNGSFLFTNNRIQENSVFIHPIINTPEYTKEKIDSKFPIEKDDKKDTIETSGNFIDINQLNTFHEEESESSLQNKLKENDKLLERIDGIVNDDSDKKENKTIENNHQFSDWEMIGEDKKSHHFYIKFKLATSKIFSFFNNELKGNYVNIIGSLIFNEFNRKSINIALESDKQKENDIAYLSCSTTIRTIEELTDKYVIKPNIAKENITIDKVDFKFNCANKNKAYSLRFKNSTATSSLFFPPKDKPINFSPICTDEYDDNLAKPSGKRFYITKIFNKDYIKGNFSEKSIKNYVISYAKNLSTDTSNHAFIEYDPFDKDKKRENYDTKKQFYVEISFSENDVINSKLREDYCIKTITISYTPNENEKDLVLGNTGETRISIRENEIYKEIYPELEITEHDLSLNKF